MAQEKTQIIVFYLIESFFLSILILLKQCREYAMAISDFAIACSLDESPPYFTYHGDTMLIVQSKLHAQTNQNSFGFIEPFIEALISHETIHVVIKKVEGETESDSLDDIEVLVEHNGMRFQVTLNNMLFANDKSGIVLP